jgi:hypothetical protein
VAAWIATLAEAANDLEDLLIDVPPEERVLPDYRTGFKTPPRSPSRERPPPMVLPQWRRGVVPSPRLC